MGEEKIWGESESCPEEIGKNAEEAVFLENDKNDKNDKTDEALSEADKLRSEIEELKAQLAAARADLYNYRQRTERDRLKTRKLIAEDKISEFLPVLDNLDRALSVPETGTAKDVLIGVRMVRQQFLSVLEGSEVTPIPAKDCPFDPLAHDAVETEFVDEPERDGAVLHELLRGYRTPERVLRPAQVRVGRLKN